MKPRQIRYSFGLLINKRKFVILFCAICNYLLSAQYVNLKTAQLWTFSCNQWIMNNQSDMSIQFYVKEVTFKDVIFKKSSPREPIPVAGLNIPLITIRNGKFHLSLKFQLLNSNLSTLLWTGKGFELIMEKLKECAEWKYRNEIIHRLNNFWNPSIITKTKILSYLVTELNS